MLNLHVINKHVSYVYVQLGSGSLPLIWLHIEKGDTWLITNKRICNKKFLGCNFPNLIWNWNYALTIMQVFFLSKKREFSLWPMHRCTNAAGGDIITSLLKYVCWIIHVSCARRMSSNILFQPKRYMVFRVSRMRIKMLSTATLFIYWYWNFWKPKQSSKVVQWGHLHEIPGCNIKDQINKEEVVSISSFWTYLWCHWHDLFYENHKGNLVKTQIVRR